MEDTIESGQPRNTTEEEGLANLAESIHINPPEMATMTEEPRTEELVDENTGHRIRRIANIVDDEAALRRATGPNRADPPSGGPEQLPELPPIRLPQDDRPNRGSPEEDFPEEEDFLEEEDFPEEEDSPEEKDIPEEEEYRQEDHPEEAGGHHQCPYHKPIKGSW